MDLVDKRTASVLITIVLFIAAGAFIYGAGRILILFLLAILFAYLLEPLVSRLQLWAVVSRGSRNLAILEVYAILSLAIAVTVLLAGPRIMAAARIRKRPDQYQGGIKTTKITVQASPAANVAIGSVLCMVVSSRRSIAAGREVQLGPSPLKARAVTVPYERVFIAAGAQASSGANWMA